MAQKQEEIGKVLQSRSERVKMIDMHPKEPLILCSLYSGQVTLWNFDTKTMVKSFEIIDQPVRCCKFITRLQSFACGCDDMCVRVYNYNTMEKVKTFEAHDDYIRGMAVHDQLPYLLTSSDDMTIKLWDWSKGWQNTLIFEGHAHYVMQVVFNPKDPSTFATASLDATIKVWNVTTPVPNFTLEGHEEGVNCIEYYPGGDKPYLISGSDDRTVRIWDYQTKACIQVLSHHSNNVVAVLFHPDVPMLFTGSEDETVGVISTQTWRQEHTLNYGLQRCWTIAARAGTNRVACGFDRGMVVLKVGKDEPVISMDSNGKILFSSANEILRMDIKSLADRDVQDGEPLTLPSKEIGTTENAPTKILHGPSGQYIAVLTEGEYTVNSSLAWRPKTFGQAIDFVWGSESGSYAILENSTTLKTFKQFKAKDTLRLSAPADALFGGPLLGARVDGALVLFDWENFNVVRRIDEEPKAVEWSDSGELMALVTESTMYILKYRAEDVAAHFAAGQGSTEDGLDFAFDLVEGVEERARQALWVGDCLVFVNGTDHLNYYIGGEVTSVATLNKGVHVLGYLPKENRIFCIDKDRQVMSYQLFVSVIQYKTAIVREAFDEAAAVLPQIPESKRFKVAQFLQARGHLDLALDVTTEDDHRFDLAVQLGRLDVVHQIARSSDSATRWKQVGDIALQQARFDLAEEALTRAADFNGLLLLHSCTCNRAAIAKLGRDSLAKGRANVAFTCFHTVGMHAECVDVLVATGKVAEAAFYARTYCHGKVDELVGKWKNAVAGLPRLREAIADPTSFPNLFPNIEVAPKKEATPASSRDATPAKAPPSPERSEELATAAPAAASPAPASAISAATAAAAVAVASPPPPPAPPVEDEINFDDEEPAAAAAAAAAPAPPSPPRSSAPAPAAEAAAAAAPPSPPAAAANARADEEEDIFGDDDGFPAAGSAEKAPAPAAAALDEDDDWNNLE